MSSMGRRVSRGVFSICALAVGFAASSDIGLVVTNGSFQLAHSNVRGSVTLFDGNLIETNASSPQLRFNDATSLRRAAESRARVYHYRIEAAGLRIETDRPGSGSRPRWGRTRKATWGYSHCQAR